MVKSKSNLPVVWSACLFLVMLGAATVYSQAIEDPNAWKNHIVFPDYRDPFLPRQAGASVDSAFVRWIKFTILLDPYDKNVVYFQNSRQYPYHYDFAASYLEPFAGLSTQQFNALTLYRTNQQAVLGSVFMPPTTTGASREPLFNEIGIEFVRNDPFRREEIRDLFNIVKRAIVCPNDVQIFYFPKHEQRAQAEADKDWFAAQGIPVGSTAQWSDGGNTCYSQGWGLGQLKYFPYDEIDSAYQSGHLLPSDILITNGIPAELPFVSGIISLVPSTPNSHVAILSRTYRVPFVHLAEAQDAAYAQSLIGRRILFSAYLDAYGACDVRLLDTDQSLSDTFVDEILQLKQPSPLNIAPMAYCGAWGLPTDTLLPSDVHWVGGKAANFGILRRAIPESSPVSLGLTFDVWNAFLDLPIQSGPSLVLNPGDCLVFWADGDETQGPTHMSFKLDKDGEEVGLFSADGVTLIDAVQFGPQLEDVSLGRTSDANDPWRFAGEATPGRPNPGQDASGGLGLVINELMADNTSSLEDPCEPGQYPDWIELYNGSSGPVTLNGMYLTDDINDPTKWQIPLAATHATLRQEIAARLSAYDTYPPPDIQQVAGDLAFIRSLITRPDLVPLSEDLRRGILSALTDPNLGFDPNATLRFRSSTNVEDSEDFTGAGLYDSYSGCLADELDGDDVGPCRCDPNRSSERGVFQAIRRVFASFFNDNAYLERLRRSVNEDEVGMAVLVHHSFPDDLELANGVATMETQTDDETNISTRIIKLVTQAGAVSVTNPPDASIPEEVTVQIQDSGAVIPNLTRSSSLVPTGAYCMTWRDDYLTLARLLDSVYTEYGLTTGKTDYILDAEFKKMAPGGQVLPAGGLVVKQVRPLPEPNQTSTITPFLINQPVEYELFTGEFELFGQTDVFAQHRLKSRWTIETRNMRMDNISLEQSLYGMVRIEYLAGDEVHTVINDPSVFPGAAHTFNGTDAVESWHMDDPHAPRAYRLVTTDIPTQVSRGQNPLFMLTDLGTYGYTPYKCLTLDVDYTQAVASWDHYHWSNGAGDDALTTTQNSRVYLWPRTAPRDKDVFAHRTLTSGGITIITSFYFPPPPAGLTSWVNATAPLKHWDRTIIEGLTSEPIVLQGYFSQTYRPEHHNLQENFLFEPRLEPGLSPDTLAELNAMDVRFIHLIIDHEDETLSTIRTYGFDLPDE